MLLLHDILLFRVMYYTIAVLYTILLDDIMLQCTIVYYYDMIY